MAGTINYLYDPSQLVYVIVDCIDPNNRNNSVLAVRPGKVVRVRYEGLSTTSLLAYDIQIEKQSGTTEVHELDIFTDLTSAVIEYQSRLMD